MRLLKALPEIEPQIQEGSLSLCVAARTQSFFKKEDRKRKEEGEERLSLEFKQEIVSSMVGRSTRECERKLAEISPESAIPQEKTRPVARDRTLIQFVADQELMTKLEKLKGLLAHQNFEGRYDELFKILADLALKKLDPEEKRERKSKSSVKPAFKAKPEVKPVRNPENGNAADSPTFPALENEVPRPHSRYIPTLIRQRVWKRDQARCTFTDPKTGQRCESKYALQYDHAIPYAWGGETSEANLRLRCFSHNRHTAIQQGLIPMSKVQR